eukprot:gene14525-5587_t
MERRYNYLWIVIISALAAIVLCKDKTSNTTIEATEGNSVSSLDQAKIITKKDLKADLSKKKSYLRRFAQSWKYYAKANDIAKREKLRKALLDALKSMNTKRKSTVTSLTHDTVERIQHAASMLKEFKRMYSLSNDVMSTWKDYESARKNLLDIGKTQAGSDILKKYVILRDEVSNKIAKRNQIAKPTIVDDQDIQESIEKDKIARHGVALKSGNLIFQRAMTPGTLQILRPNTNRDTEAEKRMELLSDAKEAARQAYSKAKEAIAALKEKLKGASASTKSAETNDKGTNKKSILAEGENKVRGESLGHVNSAMAISSMIKKAEKEDLANIGGLTNLFQSKTNQQTGATLGKSNEKQVVTNSNEKQAVTNSNEKQVVTNSNENQAVTNSNEKQVVINSNQYIQNKTSEQSSHKKEMAQNAPKATPTTSISSLMDSLAEADESQQTKAQSKHENNTAESPTKINPLFLGATKEASNDTKTQNQAQVNEKAAPKVVTSQIKANETKNDTSITPVNTSGDQTAAIMLMKSIATEHREMRINGVQQPEQQNISRVDASKNNASSSPNNSSAAPSTVQGTKRFHLSEVTIREEVAKTIDRQLETLKRLQDAKKARRRYETAKKELQSKIKKLYDMAVSFEKPIKDAQEMRTNIDQTPDKDQHPGAALAGISDKRVMKVSTPSDDSEHHGFTLGVMDSKSKAHIVDIESKSPETLVEKVYQVGLQGSDTTEAARKSGVKDEALKSLTDAIKNDLKKIEENQKRQRQEERQSTDLKNVIGPLISKFVDVKDSHKEKPTEKAVTKPEIAMQALGEKKDDAPPKEKEDISTKAEDAFKEVEDYLSKALKHVAKEAITEEGDSGQPPEFKESSAVVNEEDSAKIKSQTTKANDGGVNEDKKKEEPKQEADKKEEKDVQKNEKDDDSKKEEKTEKPEVSAAEKPKEEGKEKTKEMDRNERLRKIVEDAMKAHAKDPSNPHPVDAELFKPTAKLKKDETTAKVTEKSKSQEKKVVDQKSVSAQPSAPTTSTSSSSSPSSGVINRSNDDAIAKAEHLEEQAASLQDTLYSQGKANDAYKSIDNVEQKPLFSQEQQEQQMQRMQQYASPGEQPIEYDDEEEEEDRRKKKSFLQNMPWPSPYRNYQRDQIMSRNAAKKEPEAPMMNTGMMNDAERDELEDTKKSEVPKAKGSFISMASTGRSKMYIL